jgi:hypothetical protein
MTALTRYKQEPNHGAVGWAVVGITVLLFLAGSLSGNAVTPTPKWKIGDIVYITPGGQQAQINTIACLPGEATCMYDARLASDPSRVIEWIKEVELR